jgi:signal transduction histidine kinase
MGGESTAFNAAQIEVLERIATGALLRDVLEAIVRLVERQASGMLCSILLLDGAKQRLRHGAAPSLPAAYTRLLDGSAIGPEEGSCGAAAYLGQRVIVEDILTHPFWTSYRAAASPHGLRACWSSPIFSPEREVLGTFAMYYQESRGPTEQEVAWVGAATHLAAVAIMRDRSVESLRSTEDRAWQLARLYAVSSGISDALIHFREPQQLYDAACRIAVEKGLAALAWIGSYDEAADRIVPVASFGTDSGYASTVVLRLRDAEVKQGPAAKALRTRAPAISNDIAVDPDFHWKEAALQRGLRSCAVFPLIVAGHPPAVFAIYGETVGFFRDEEASVLSALALNIAFAVESAKSGEERLRLVGELRENEAALRIAGEVARLGAWSLDPTTQRLTWSDQVCAIHEVPNGTAPSVDSALAFYAPEHIAAARAMVFACIRDGTPFDVELQIITARGRRGWVRAIGRAERNAAGDIARIHGAFQDIDERRRLEDHLRQSQKMDAIGQLAAGVAHDFNNLLSVILSYASIIADGLPPGDRARADVEEIRTAGERAADLTRQLLTFSRQQVVEPRRIDLDDIVAGLDKMLRRLIGENVILSVMRGPSLGQVFVDPGQAEQILMNLVVNARDAMPKGGNVRIELANATLDSTHGADHHDVVPGQYVMLAVSDDGEGMDAATRARIFEPFFTTKEKGKGTGLGLATVYGIVAQSGGYVWVFSEPGGGTTFKVYFPRRDGSVDVEVASRPQPTKLHGSETILLVEDAEQVRTLVRSILRRAGYKVLEAQNGKEALLLSEHHTGPIDLLLTDVVMPRMGGRELAQQLSQKRPELRILFMSGYPDDTSAHPGVLDAGITGIALLPKPITPQALLVKTREVMDAGPPKV